MTKKMYDSVGRNYIRHTNVRITQIALERNRHRLNNIQYAGFTSGRDKKKLRVRKIY
jgi:hypothetical protein